MATLNIAEEFSKFPSGRYYSDGDKSGEEFREKYLVTALGDLKDDEVLDIIIDNVNGYGSSFLVEGFAGVVKYGYMTANDLTKKIKISFEDPDFEFFKRKIYQYINEAKFDSVKYTPTSKR